MERRRHHARARRGDLVLLLAVTTLALAIYGPCTAGLFDAPLALTELPAAADRAAKSDALPIVEQWQETMDMDPDLIQMEVQQVLIADTLAQQMQAQRVVTNQRASIVASGRKHAQGLSTAIVKFRGQATKAPAGSLQQHLLNERLSLLAQERAALNRLLKQILSQLRSERDTARFRQALNRLEGLFHLADITLTAHQQIERMSVSASTFTSPSF